MSRPTKAERERRRLEETAYHEAGHAVIAIHLRRGFKHVTIEPGEDSLGHVKPDKHPESFRPDVDVDRKGVARIEREVMVLLAGTAAVKRLRSRNNWGGAGKDLSMAVNIASYLHDGRVLERYLSYMVERARVMIAQPYFWIQVEALANALLERKTLSAREARAVCTKAVEDEVHERNLSAEAVAEEDERERRAMEKEDTAQRKGRKTR